MLSRLLRGFSLIAWAMAAWAALAAIARPAGAADGVWLPLLNNGPPRQGYAAAFDTKRQQLVFYGGRSPEIHFGPGSHSVAYDIAVWGAMTDSGFVAALSSAPGVRENAAAAYDRITDRFYLFGGDSVVAQPTGGGFYNYRPLPYADLWYADRSAGDAWHRVLPSGAAPTPRFGASLVVDEVRHRLVLFGGRDTLGNSFNETWVMPLDAPPAWTLLPTTGTPPAPTFDAPAVYDPVRDRLLVMANNGAAIHNELRALSLSGAPVWSIVPITGVPPVNPVSALDYDPLRDALVAGMPRMSIFRIPLGGAPAWVPLAFGNASPDDDYGTLRVIGYDSRDDMLFLPTTYEYADASFTGTQSDRIAFDRTQTAGVPGGSGGLLRLEQPFPNPARAVGAIRFELPDASPARLELLDLGGRTRLRRDYAGPGAFTFTLPGRALAPGVYFLRLSGSGRNLTERLVIAP